MAAFSIRIPTCGRCWKDHRDEVIALHQAHPRDQQSATCPECSASVRLCVRCGAIAPITEGWVEYVRRCFGAEDLTV